MGIEIKKQERETSQALIYRFSRSVKKSGILLRARKTRFRQRQKSRQMKRRSSLRREELKKEYEKLRKLGKLKK